MWEGTFPKASIVGVDVDKVSLNKCFYNSKVCADACFLPFRDNIFTASVELCCLPYVKDWKKARTEMFRVAKHVYFVEQIRNKKRLHWFSLTTLFHFGSFMFLFLRTIVIKGRKTKT